MVRDFEAEGETLLEAGNHEFRFSLVFEAQDRESVEGDARFSVKYQVEAILLTGEGEPNLCISTPVRLIRTMGLADTRHRRIRVSVPFPYVRKGSPGVM